MKRLRKTVQIKEKLYRKILKLGQEQRDYDPKIFLCGLKGNVVCEIEELDVKPVCEYAPDIESEDIAKAYVKLAKKGYTPAGMIRVMFEEDEGDLLSYAHRDWCSGTLDQNCGDFLISVSKYGILAEHAYGKTKTSKGEDFRLKIRIIHK